MLLVMRKLSIFCCLLLLTTFSDAQGDTLPFPFLSVSPNIPCYIYHNNQDTIRFTPLDFPGFSTLVFNLKDSIQIDGAGAKELLFEIRCESNFNDHGGTFDYDEQTACVMYEIWNPDTRQRLFQAIYNYKATANSRDYSTDYEKNGEESYSYSIKVDKAGKIFISDIKKVEKMHVYIGPPRIGTGEITLKKKRLIPDHSAGVYVYSQGKYIKLK
jgi:hypothetical protein